MKCTGKTQAVIRIGYGESPPEDVFVVGGNPKTGDVILHYDGISWSRMASNASSMMKLNGVWGTSPNNVYAVGRFGRILHYDGEL